MIFSKNELKVLPFLCNSFEEINIERKTDQDFDLLISGKEYGGHKFTAWVPLLVIARANWTDPRIWKIQDGYGAPGFKPAQGFDWSGIRDSEEETIWRMPWEELSKIRFMKRRLTSKDRLLANTR
jgi:hypothetical protein